MRAQGSTPLHRVKQQLYNSGTPQACHIIALVSAEKVPHHHRVLRTDINLDLRGVGGWRNLRADMDWSMSHGASADTDMCTDGAGLLAHS